jgi:hypothetical protein
MVSELKFVILAHLLKTANFVHFHSSFDSVVEAIVKRLKYPDDHILFVLTHIPG